MASIKVSELSQAVAQELADYSQDVTDGVKKEVKQVAKDMVTELKQTSPRNSGDYAKGWKSRVEYESPEDIRVRVYNSKKPQLTHLLENGHAKVSGGRVSGIPHIGPAELEAEKKLDSKVKVVVKG